MQVLSRKESIRASFEMLFEDYPLVEKFTPLRSSHLWTLNVHYWQQRGAAAFISDAVPYIATSDGTLSVATADLLVAHARSLAVRGVLPSKLTLVEIGPGSGLFARITMHRYAELRVTSPELPPLLYIGIDSSSEMIESLKQLKSFAAPGCETVFIQAEVTSDLEAFCAVLESRLPLGAAALCVCNYVLDNFPATTLRREGDAVLEKEVELRLMTVAAEMNAELVHESLPFDSILIRTREIPVTSDDPAFSFASSLLTRNGDEIPYNTGAHACLRTLGNLGTRIGMILVNDYEIGSFGGATEPVQFFAGSIAMGLHFPTLDKYMSEFLNWEVTQPSQTSEIIVSRLYTPTRDDHIQELFSKKFTFDDAKRARSFAAAARSALSEGRVNRALAYYECAIEANLWNWSLLIEVAGFVHTYLKQDGVAMKFALQALDLNPICAEAFNIIGDCHYRMGDQKAARKAFQKVIKVNVDEPRGFLNLAYCDAKDGNFKDALATISRGLAADKNGSITSELLLRQQEIVEQIRSKKKS